MKEHPEEILDTVLLAWNREAANWSAQRLSTLYTQDALFFGGREGHAVGAAAITAYFDSYHGVIFSAKLKLLDQQLLRLSDDAIMAQGFGEFDFVLAGDKSTQSVLRTTLVICREADDWKICAHHFSTIPSVPPLGE